MDHPHLKASKEKYFFVVVVKDVSIVKAFNLKTTTTTTNFYSRNGEKTGQQQSVGET